MQHDPVYVYIDSIGIDCVTDTVDETRFLLSDGRLHSQESV